MRRKNSFTLEKQRKNKNGRRNNLDFAPIYVFINLKIKPTPFCGLFLKEKEETGPVTLICTVHRFNHQPNCFTPIIKKISSTD
jgi:hypothetical protein